MTLGEKIKEARKQCGLSQEQLAEKMSVSRSAIAKWETDKGLPDIDNLKALAGFLNVSVDYLLGFFTDSPFGTPELINSFKNIDKEFYLVTRDGKQFLVTVTDEFIETRKFTKPITADKFEIGNWKFTKCKYEVK